jgi:hypothetical protein
MNEGSKDRVVTISNDMAPYLDATGMKEKTSLLRNDLQQDSVDEKCTSNLGYL